MTTTKGHEPLTIVQPVPGHSGTSSARKGLVLVKAAKSYQLRWEARLFFSEEHTGVFGRETLT